MTLNRINRRVAFAVLLWLIAAPALAQEYSLRGAQLFAPADISPYGNGPGAHEGYFGSFEELYWSTSKPHTVTVGDETPVLVGTHVTQIIIPPFPAPIQNYFAVDKYMQKSTVDTSPFESKSVGGERVEFGRVVGGWGWEISIFRLRDCNQGFTAFRAPVNFIDPPVNFEPLSQKFVGLMYGQVGTGTTVTGYTPFPIPTANVTATVRVDSELPTEFTRLDVEQQTKLWGIEATLVRRTKQLHHGGYLEFYLSARYIEFEDNFEVFGQGNALNPLDQADWRTAVENHILGPQIGLRWFKQSGRFLVNAEGRFLAGYERQNVNQRGYFGTNNVPGTLGNPLAWPGNAFVNHETFNEFSPVLELRLDLKYVLTRSFSLRAGWSALWIDNVRRGSNLNIYQVPALGIDPSPSKLQDVLVQGLSMGAEINR